MTKKERKQYKLDKPNEDRTYWLEAILMILVFIGLGFFLFSCSIHNYEMNPNIYYLNQDNKGISVCSVDQRGGTFCQRNLDQFKGKRVFLVPETQFTKD